MLSQNNNRYLTSMEIMPVGVGLEKLNPEVVIK
jgi:hypothetical protein